MKVNLMEIIAAKDVLSRLANTDLPIKVSYALSKLIKILNEEYQDIEKFRTNLVSKYGEPDGENIRVRQESENFPKFMEEYNDFMNTEIEIKTSKIEIDVKKTDIQIKPIDLINIAPFVNFVGITDNELSPDVETGNE